MKRISFLILLFLVSFFTRAQEVVLSRDFGNGSVRIERRIDNEAFRQKKDGSRYFKTTFTIKVNMGEQWWSNEITDIYSDKGTAMEPCMLIDKTNLYVFTLSKSNDSEYMDGIITKLDMISGEWTRETVFNDCNHGWNALFLGLEDGNPVLWHLSYALYHHYMCSIRNNDGGWSLENKGGVRPEQAANLRYIFDNFLIINSNNDSVVAKQRKAELEQRNQPLSLSHKARVYRTLPRVGPVAGEFYVGRCNANPKPKDPPITDREMSMIWEFDEESGRIAFSSPGPTGGGDRMVHYNRITIALGNGMQITQNDKVSAIYYYHDADGNRIFPPRYASHYTLFLPDYKEDKIIISWINAPEQTGKPDRSGYYTVFQDHRHQINYTLPINVKEAQFYYFFYKAKNASLKDAINYLKDCPYDDYRQEVENEILKSKTNSLADIVYCNDNYPKLSNKLEDRMFGLVTSLLDCEAYLKYYPANKQIDDKTYEYVSQSTEINDCETYLKYFPNGIHKAAVTAQKNEIASYKAARTGGKTECTAYLTKYPKGRFTSEIQTKKDDIVKEEKRQEIIKTNSNKGLWKLGNKLCNCTSEGVIMVTIDQWNENRSSFKGIVSASPGGIFNGDLLQKGNQLWFDTKGWHLCLDDEMDYALRNDKSLEAEQLQKAKSMKFKRGSVVSRTYYSTGHRSSHRVKGKVDEWNEDYTRMKVQIIDTDGLGSINGESVYEGKYLWVSPIGWE